MAHSHHHHAGHDRGAGHGVLAWALAANAVLAAVQIAGGLAFGSLSVLADAAHQLVDVVALATVLVAARLARRPATARRTFGWQRADLVASLVSAVLLLASCAWILVEALRRAGEDVTIDGLGVVALAIAGLVVNGGSALLLVRSASRQLGVRSAVAHLLGDAAGSAAVLVAGLAAWWFGVTWPDTVLSVAIAALVAVAAVRLLRDSLHLLLEGVPADLDPEELEAALGNEAGVVAVHHLHVWAIASDQPALSAHVQLSDGLTLHEAQEAGGRLKAMLHERFGIDHATLELECHPCEDTEHR